MTPASAYWNQRFALAASRERILALHAAVAHPHDLRTDQFAQLFATALEYQPDVILELGRGAGNSTCAFTEAANQLGRSESGAGKCRVISLCRSPSWQPVPPPAIAAVVSPEWFAPLTTCSGNILDFDYATLLDGARRVLVFWDAHGYDIAECVLGRILPLLVDREHLVIMHDLGDARFRTAEYREYGDNRLWRGNDRTGRRVWLGHIVSPVEQAVAVVDFVSRNRLELFSADETIHAELVADEAKLAELRETIGDELCSTRAQWFYFTMCGRPGPFTFPRFPTPEERGQDLNRS